MYKRQAEDLEKEKHIILAQMKEDPKNAGKPENILEKMLTGKVNKFYELNCLNQQEFVKDSNYKVEKYLAEKGIKLVDLSLIHIYFVFRCFAELKTERHIFVNRHMRIQSVVLENHCNISVFRSDVVHKLVA